MAKQTTKLGDVVVAVGSYTPGAGQTPKTSNRNIGVLMETTDETGGKRLWLKLNADILHASLFALVRAEAMEKGDDKFIANVFAPRDQSRKPSNSTATAPEDGNPY